MKEKLPMEIQAEMIIATKGGMGRHGDGRSSKDTWHPLHMTPKILKNCIIESKKSLFGKLINRQNIVLPINLHWQLHHTDEHDAFSNEFQNLMEEVKRYVSKNERTFDKKVFFKFINSVNDF